MSRKLSLHPVHLTESNGQPPPSALIPFCSYQMDTNLLGAEISGMNMTTVCNKFEQTILEGQFCYSLDVSKVEKRPSRVGKRHGLLLLLDPNPLEVRSQDKNSKGKRNEQLSFKVYIHTLAQYTAYGPGTYPLGPLKRMTGTESFEHLPDQQKRCQVHNIEKCQTKLYLDQVKTNCDCVPWALVSDASSKEVDFIDVKSLFFN